MSLQDINFRDTYWSGENDLIEEFYVPCLSESIEYCRAVGYFNSSILCYITNGLFPFIQNGGKIRILCSTNLTKEDEKNLSLGYNIRKILQDKIESELAVALDLNLANIKNLCWLVKNERLDIKICLRLKGGSRESPSLFHEKFGVFRDKDNNAVSFLGSINETYSGWLDNEESFEVSVDWIPSLAQRVESKKQRFENLWNGTAKDVVTYSFPEACRQQLIAHAPEYPVEGVYHNATRQRKFCFKPRNCQECAKEHFMRSGFNCLFMMATGSGKTKAALYSMSQLDSWKVLLICVPGIELVEQWEADVYAFFPDITVIRCSFLHPDWKRLLLALIQAKIPKRTIIITTYDSAVSDFSMDKWKSIKAKNLALICDEVHNIGAKSRRRIMELNDEAEKMDYINSIVHEDAAQYFFFDGEKINDYSVANGQEYREAIARILGIKEVENAIDDLKRIAKGYEKDRDACLEKQSQYNGILQQKKELELSVQEYEGLDRMYQAEIQDGNALISKHEEELKKFTEIGAKVARKQEISQEIKEHETELHSLEERRQELFQKNATMVLGGILFDRFNRNKGGQAPAPYLSSAVKQYLEHLLAGPKCICGELMTPAHSQHIQTYINENLITDDSIIIAQEREELFTALSKYLSHGIESKTEFLSCCETILDITIQISTLNGDLLRLKRDIGSFNEEAGEKIQQDIQRVEKKIEEAKYRKAQNDLKLQEARKKLSELEARLAQYSQANNESARCQRKLGYTQRLGYTFETYLEQLLEEKRRTVEEKATEVFLQITNNPQKYRGICINKDYRLLLELTDGERYEIEPGRMLNPSTGQSKVISLSYIAGLNKSSNYAAPIIIDNPLGLFSDEHREAITNYLPHFGKQIIFMVSSGDLTDKYRQIIAPYVKTEYYLASISKSECIS